MERAPRKPRAAVLAAVILLGVTSVALAAGDAPLGGPRRWGAGLPVGEYGAVNLETGRVLTALPVVSWGGKGPGISFSL